LLKVVKLNMHNHKSIMWHSKTTKHYGKWVSLLYFLWTISLMVFHAYFTWLMFGYILDILVVLKLDLANVPGSMYT
jgi:hypothetical protein